MEPKEKRKLEREQITAKRRLEIIQAAKCVFCLNGIENTKMTDIAEKAEVGVASVYRYFNTKPELVIDTGIDYCRSLLINIKFSDHYDSKPGIDQVAELLDWLIGLYHEAPEFVDFLQQFDFYFVLKENDHPRLCEFEDEISKFFPVLFDALNKGTKDGTIRGEANNLDTGALIFRSFVSLQQRILTRDYILSIDEKLNREKQLNILKEMVLNYLSL